MGREVNSSLQSSVEPKNQQEQRKGRIDPGRVFNRTVDLDGVPGGYRAMNEREAIKVIIRP